MRQADLVDSTAGIVNFGLDRRWLRVLFRDVSREGFSAPTLRHRPAASFATARRASPSSRRTWNDRSSTAVKPPKRLVRWSMSING